MVTVEQLGAIVSPLAVYNYDRPGLAQPGCVAKLAIEEFHAHCLIKACANSTYQALNLRICMGTRLRCTTKILATLASC